MYGVFDEHLETMTHLVENEAFKNCFNMSKDLTHISTLANFKRGVFVAEVLEGIFSQVGPLFTRYIIPESDKNKLKNQIHEDILKLSSAYKSSDVVSLYEILENMRFIATSFQSKCTSLFKRNENIKRRTDNVVI